MGLHSRLKVKTRLEVMNDLLSRNALLVDARSGGFVAGSSHEDGGIPLVQAMHVVGYPLWVEGEMEGGEFLVNPAATERHLERLIEINAFSQTLNTDDGYTGLDYKIYDINKGDAILVSNYQQFIVNRHATLRYLRELIELNSDPIYEPETPLLAPTPYRVLLEILQTE